MVCKMKVNITAPKNPSQLRRRWLGKKKACKLYIRKRLEMFAEKGGWETEGIGDTLTVSSRRDIVGECFQSYVTSEDAVL
ncbi:unnamed protein product [Cercopithifilaria johnstoni]|uniref:Uncharacterized protein n=1 Tax=Cercopithifilaria johnstoni TaxID=2874296 RepID=A0A8J2LZY4_9BILA|nr:unnamed protein product [Cercopithifilaria johnstoni]